MLAEIDQRTAQLFNAYRSASHFAKWCPAGKKRQ